MPRGFGFADIGRAVLDLQGRLGPGKPAAYEGYTRGEWEFDPGDTGVELSGLRPEARDLDTGRGEQLHQQ